MSEMKPLAKIPQLPLGASGQTIAQFGLGTYKIPPQHAQELVETALKLGYRHLDTAQMYGNESGVGAGMKSSGIPREEIFLTTKLNNPNHEPQRAAESLKESLQKLGTDYVDLFLIHWPMPLAYDGSYPQLWELMLEFQQRGLAKNVGVSNFEVEHLQKIYDYTGVFPCVNQIEAHPWFANNHLRDFTKQHGGVVQAWSPLARSRFLDDPALTALAQRLERTPAQVVLRWAIEREDVIFPKSNNPQRLAENLQIFDFSLDEAARDTLDSLDRGEAGRTGSHPNQVN